ncbi:hypothetical protein G6F25_001351 [Rhizopus arrhizus]|nr:hypothetical protein G6F25_001351 [Rhizopus arrhizus]
MKRLVVLSGSSHPQLTQNICDRLGIEPAKSRLSKFSNNETSVELRDSVREQDVYIVQSGCGHVNDNLIELLIMIQACKTASASKVTAVIPFFPYSRQPDAPYKRSGAPFIRPPPMTVPSTPTDTPSSPVISNDTNNNPFFRTVEQQIVLNGRQQQQQPKNQIQPFLNANNDGYKQWLVRSGTLIADLLTCADNLSSLPSMAKYIHFNIPDYKEAVIVSPDAGGAKRATSIADKLHMDFALIHKERRRPDKPQKHDLMLVGDVRDKVCILIDDIADTSFTITKAAKLLHENGAVKIYALITHAILSGDAIDRIQQSYLDHVIVTDSVPQDEHVKRCSKIKISPVASLFAEAIRRIHFGESVSVLFDPAYEIS